MVTGPGTKIYVSREMLSQMQIRLKDKSNVYFGRADGLDGGGKVLTFNGFDVRMCESIIDAETTVA
jgi:hypothetical protein